MHEPYCFRGVLIHPTVHYILRISRIHSCYGGLFMSLLTSALLAFAAVALFADAAVSVGAALAACGSGCAKMGHRRRSTAILR